MKREFLGALGVPGRLWAVELRPPPVTSSASVPAESTTVPNKAVRSLLEAGRFALFTDDAVGVPEEESLTHLTSTLGPDPDLSRAIPFLTAKHSLEYCLQFARRAADLGVGGLTVVGGDANVGPPRCVQRSRDLRRLIRDQVPELSLGAWVNPYKDAAGQVDLLLDPGHVADYYVTQVVSHLSLSPLERFMDEAERQGLPLPGLVGVFFYRSATRATLDRLSDFIPVPVEPLGAEFGGGASAELVCARTMAALDTIGVEKVYVSNLMPDSAEATLTAIEALVDVE